MVEHVECVATKAEPLGPPLAAALGSPGPIHSPFSALPLVPVGPVAVGMLKVIGPRVGVRTQRPVMRVGRVECLRAVHGSPASVAQRTRHEPVEQGEQGDTDGVVGGVVAACMPAATLGVLGLVAQTSAGATPRVAAVGEPVAVEAGA
jgi:hypothetical protein